MVDILRFKACIIDSLAEGEKGSLFSGEFEFTLA
jgi:hypothetical protein